MRVGYKYHPERPPSASFPRLPYVEHGELSFCCRQMKREWGCTIGFGYRGSGRCDRPAVYFYHTFFEAGGESYTGILQIAHCPFCGRRIVMVEVG
jgi:hypothetical protein